MLDYVALIILIIGLTLVFYTFIYIHDLPYQAAKKRDHPHTEAIHVACWLSLFTLHAIWPIVFIWAVSHRPGSTGIAAVPAGSDAALREQLAALDTRLRRLEGATNKTLEAAR